MQRYNNYLNQPNKYESIVQLLTHFNLIVCLAAHKSFIFESIVSRESHI